MLHPPPGQEETSGADRLPLSTVLFTANEAATGDRTGQVTGGMKAKSGLSFSTDGTGGATLQTMQEKFGFSGCLLHGFAFQNLNTSSYLAV